jgi:hypothetical protein
LGSSPQPDAKRRIITGSEHEMNRRNEFNDISQSWRNCQMRMKTVLSTRKSDSLTRSTDRSVLAIEERMTSSLMILPGKPLK